MADIQVQIYSKSSWNSKGWRIGKYLCLNASTSRPYNCWIHNAIVSLPYLPSHASFNLHFPFCILLWVARLTFQSSSISQKIFYNFVVFLGSYNPFQDIYSRYIKSLLLFSKRGEREYSTIDIKFIIIIELN